MRFYLMNTPILTSFGVYEYQQITEEQARKLTNGVTITSAIGHKGTAKLLEDILNRPVPVNRIKVTMNRGDMALIVQLLGPRLAPGTELSIDEMRKRGFVLGLLKRVR